MSDAYKLFLKALANLKDNQERSKTICENAHLHEKKVEEVEHDFSAYLEDVLREKVRDMLSCEFLLQQKIKKSQILEWVKTFVSSAKDAENLIETYSMEHKEIETYNIAQLLELAKQSPSRFIVKGFIQLGALYLLVASPKVGKSLLSTSLAVSTARGTSFLNREVEQGNVLYIQNEERIQSTTVNRIYDHGLQKLELEDPELYQDLITSEKLLVSRNYDIVLDQERIVKYVKEKDIKLVIVDSLGASIRRSGLTEFSPELATSLYKLQSEAHHHGFTVLILHHATKMDGSDNRQQMLNGVAGTNALSRVPDGIFRLFPDKEQTGIIHLRTIPREGEPLSISLALEKEEANLWYFKIIKESVLSVENIEVQNVILRFLYERWNAWKQEVGDDICYEMIEQKHIPDVYGYTVNELVELTDIDRNELIRRLNDMRSTEAISITKDTITKSHVFIIHWTGECWLKSYLEQDEAKRREEEEKKRVAELYQQQIEIIAEDIKLIIEQAINGEISSVDAKDKITKIRTHLKPNEKMDVEAKLSEKEKKQIKLLFFPPDYNIGDEMIVIETNLRNKIIDIDYVLKDDGKGYHKYYLQDEVKPYLKEQLEKYETENHSTSNPERELQEQQT